MRLLLESKGIASHAVHNAFVKGGLESFLWNNDEAGIIDVYDQVKPDIIIINSQCKADQCNAVQSLEPSARFIFMGDWDNRFPKPILSLSNTSSDTFPTIPLPERIFDTSMIVNSFFDNKVACQISMFTDMINDNFLNSNTEVINMLISMGVRMFGNVKIPVPNYLGAVDHELKSKIIVSSDICIDLTGDMWETIALSNGVVLSTKSPLEEFSFKDTGALNQKIQQFLKSRPNTSSLKMLAMERSGISLCIELFRFLQAQPLVENFIKMRQSFV